MRSMTIGEVIQLIRSWAISRTTNIIEIILVGSQSKIKEVEALKEFSDIDMIIIIDNNSNPSSLMSDLADVGIQKSILFHPLIMTVNEKQEKLNIKHYKNMYESGKKIFPA